MACHGARRLLEMNKNLAGILGVEAMSASQGIELRAPLKTSARLRDIIQTIRGECSSLTDDRIVSTDIEKLSTLLLDTDRICLLDNGVEPIGLSV